MARAHFVKKARKDIPGTDIKAGDSYYWWKFRFGGKHYSKTPPRRSQLTQSSFYATLWDIEDEIAALGADDSLPSEIEGLAQQLRDLAEECQNSLDNMPEPLQQSETGEMLQERVSACESAADELESIDADVDNKGDDETAEEFWERVLQEVQAVSIDAP